MSRKIMMPTAVVAGAAVAVLAGIAIARSFTLEVARNAAVVNQHKVTKHETIAVTSRGSAVYMLSGETVRHQKCKSGQCFGFWPPVKVASKTKPSAQPGIHGKLGTFRRDGFTQVTLNGHPLYTFARDSAKDTATGEGVVSFGGTWHVVSADHARAVGTTSAQPTPSTTTPTTTTTCLYPGYC